MPSLTHAHAHTLGRVGVFVEHAVGSFISQWEEMGFGTSESEEEQASEQADLMEAAGTVEEIAASMRELEPYELHVLIAQPAEIGDTAAQLQAVAELIFGAIEHAEDALQPALRQMAKAITDLAKVGATIGTEDTSDAAAKLGEMVRAAAELKQRLQGIDPEGESAEPQTNDARMPAAESNTTLREPSTAESPAPHPTTTNAAQPARTPPHPQPVHATADVVMAEAQLQETALHLQAAAASQSQPSPALAARGAEAAEAATSAATSAAETPAAAQENTPRPRRTATIARSQTIAAASEDAALKKAQDDKVYADVWDAVDLNCWGELPQIDVFNTITDDLNYHSAFCNGVFPLTAWRGLAALQFTDWKDMFVAARLLPSDPLIGQIMYVCRRTEVPPSKVLSMVTEPSWTEALKAECARYNIKNVDADDVKQKIASFAADRGQRASTQPRWEGLIAATELSKCTLQGTVQRLLGDVPYHPWSLLYTGMLPDRATSSFSTHSTEGAVDDYPEDLLNMPMQQVDYEKMQTEIGDLLREAHSAATKTGQRPHYDSVIGVVGLGFDFGDHAELLSNDDGHEGWCGAHCAMPIVRDIIGKDPQMLDDYDDEQLHEECKQQLASIDSQDLGLDVAQVCQDPGIKHIALYMTSKLSKVRENLEKWDASARTKVNKYTELAKSRTATPSERDFRAKQAVALQKTLAHARERRVHLELMESVIAEIDRAASSSTNGRQSSSVAGATTDSGVMQHKI